MGKADSLREPTRHSVIGVYPVMGITGLTLILVGCWDWHLCWIPLLGFLTLCLAAPFFPGWGFFLPVISKGNAKSGSVALTFDDGPCEETTPRLMELLAKLSVRATFFVVGKLAVGSPGLIRELRESGHEIGNHTYSHDVLLMLRTTRILDAEVGKCQEALRSLHIETQLFRPPVGITNPRLGRTLGRLGLRCITFSRRGGDRGNRRISNLAQRVLRGVHTGDIILLHDRQGNQGFNVERWLQEVEQIIVGLRKKQIQLTTVSELLGLADRKPSTQPQSPGGLA